MAMSIPGKHRKGVEYLINRVKELLNDGYNNDDLLILYRRTKMFSEFKAVLKREEIKVPAKTIHASKGLEAKVVFVIGLTEGYGGFPYIWQADRILQVIKQENYELLLEEERRLFYVAMTKAKDELILITEAGNESSFVEEIPEDYYIMKNTNIALGEDEIICKECKNELKESWIVCPFCGKNINKQVKY